eukprot:COSAG05_NODE_13025_length_444_cov_1.344928_2_plen_80_part_01
MAADAAQVVGRLYNARECREQWALQHDPRRWAALRPPSLTLWCCRRYDCAANDYVMDDDESVAALEQAEAEEEEELLAWL